MVQAAPDAERCAHHKESNEASPWLRITFREHQDIIETGALMAPFSCCNLYV
jgi:hypothetical protein